ncbi:hypothetical protein COB55_03400 [Candidatus Wolfebacteria bacterium]|nr:MAG: hypothetical protein COB55_03400 [Candidatus Wolfebacteria bacterium]
METKICTGCDEEKELLEYHISKKGKYGRSSKCKKCCSVAKPKEILPEGFKRCFKCKKVKLLEEFNKDKSRKEGRVGRCKICINKPKEELPEGYKRCTGKCKKVKLFEEFVKRGNQCKLCITEYNKQWAEEHKEEREKYRKQWRIYNAEHVKEYEKQHYEDNKEWHRLYSKLYLINNPDYRKNYKKRRRETDIGYKILENFRSRLWYLLNGSPKYDTTMKLVGCSIEELIGYLESLFYGDMTLENYGTYWVIDHIIPCVLFDFSNPEHQKICFHWTNLQPLTVKDNLEKGTKLDWVRK